MSMTRDEIIEAYESAVFSSGLSAAAGNEEAARDYELLKAGLDALRPVSREQVEKVRSWRGEWVGVPNMGVYDTACSKCGYCPGIRFWDSDFCPNCGAPMTDEAVQVVMERLETLKDGKDD